MPRTPDLFAGTEHARTRRPRRVLMQAVDGGEGSDGYPVSAHFVCPRCQHDDGWWDCTRTEYLRGTPCPHCNPEVDHVD